MKLDIDHIEPYDEKKRKPDKPDSLDETDAQTSTDNLAPLCRRHHRVKTFGHWSYVRLGPGEYLWTSKHRYQWITDTDGTRRVVTAEGQPEDSG